jgi:hypothetical protein
MELLLNIELNVAVNLYTLNADLVCEQGCQDFLDSFFLQTSHQYVYVPHFLLIDLLIQPQKLFPVCIFI